MNVYSGRRLSQHHGVPSQFVGLCKILRGIVAYVNVGTMLPKVFLGKQEGLRLMLVGAGFRAYSYIIYKGIESQCFDFIALRY